MTMPDCDDLLPSAVLDVALTRVADQYRPTAQPPFAELVSRRRRRTGGRVASAAGVALVAATALALGPGLPFTGSAVDSAATTPASPEANALTGIEWQLVEMVISGRTVPVDGVDAVLRFDGDGGYSANGCNYLEGEVDIGDGTLVLQAGESTTVFCGGLTGEIDDALNSLSGSTVAWSVDGDGLLLAGEDGTTLQYRQRDSVYPGAGNDLEVVAGERDGWQYRLSVSQTDGHASGLNLVSRAGPGQPWSTQSLGAPSPGEAPLWSIVGTVIDGQNFVAGFVPATAANATHQRTADAEPIELTIHDIGDEQWVVVAGFVPEHSPDSVISVHDAAGVLIAQWAHESPP